MSTMTEEGRARAAANKLRALQLRQQSSVPYESLHPSSAVNSPLSKKSRSEENSRVPLQMNNLQPASLIRQNVVAPSNIQNGSGQPKFNVPNGVVRPNVNIQNDVVRPNVNVPNGNGQSNVNAQNGSGQSRAPGPTIVTFSNNSVVRSTNANSASVSVQPKIVFNPTISKPSNNVAPSKPLHNPFALPPKPSANKNPLDGYIPNVVVDFEVISPCEASVSINPYLDEVKDLIKSYKSARYDKCKGEWSIGFRECPLLVSSLKSMRKAKCTVNELPACINKVFSAANKFAQLPMSSQEMDETFSNASIEHSLLSKLFPYQRLGVAFGIQKQGRLLIADEMGLGKSIQALAIARCYSSEWPLLIVCPSSVKYAWKQQIKQFLPHITNITIIEKGSDRLPNERTSNTVIIISYDLMTNKQKDLMAAGIYVIIFDESHLLKEHKTKRTKVALALAKKAQRRILLSGTPALSRPSELFTQIQLVDPTIFPTWTSYALRYCDFKKTFFGYEAKGAEKLDELSLILKHAVMIRRLKSEVLDDLPEKTREILYLSGDKINTQLKALKKTREEYEKAEKGGDASVKEDRLMTYFMETGNVKADCIADWILDSYFYKDAAPVKILLFAHHSSVLDVFSARFSVAKVKTIRIDGSTKGPERERACKSFQEDPDVSIAVLSITAAGTGITLTAANIVIFGELHWTPGTLFQAEDRAHRVGQKSNVRVLYILARSTADDLIFPKIQEKVTVVANLNLLKGTETSNLAKQELVLNGEEQPLVSNYFNIIE